MSRFRLLARLASTIPKSPIGASRTAHFHTSGVARDGRVLDITGKDFEAMVKKSDKPLIVDFYANWCGPCKVLGPILVNAVSENKKVTLIKIDVDEALDVASKYNVTALPTVAAFLNGEIKDIFIGARNQEFVKQFVEKHAARAK